MIGAPISQQTARRLRETFTPEEQQAIEQRVSDLFHFLGRSYSAGVLRELAFAEDPLRFTELQERIEAPPNTLSDRLSTLKESGFVRRRSYDERPPRVEYEATEKAEALFPALSYVDWWATEYDFDPEC